MSLSIHVMKFHVKVWSGIHSKKILIQSKPLHKYTLCNTKHGSVNEVSQLHVVNPPFLWHVYDQKKKKGFIV